MFFIMGITDGQKQLDFNQTILCGNCGGYGRYEVFMTYTVLTLFFIPVFRWNRQYFVRTTCCNALYRLDREVGKRIAKGENVVLSDRDLQPLGTGQGSVKRCGFCGFTTTEDYEHCPKCGRRF